MKYISKFFGIILLCAHLNNFSLIAQTSTDSLTSSASTIIETIRIAQVINTGALLMIGVQQAVITGSINSNQSSDIFSAGICWSTNPHPSLNDLYIACNPDTGNFTIKLDKLSPGTVYFVRAFAEMRNDTLFGEEKAFYTHKKNSIMDVDSNFYNIVQIGEQVWLAEDLKTTRFNDGELIPLVPGHSVWVGISTPAYCWYGNDSVKFSFPRGKLYNWYAVSTGKICPIGWHVPSNQEWTALSRFLGGDSIAGGKLKTPGTIFWRIPNKGATNSTGFSSFPGGYRNGSGIFLYGTIFNNWWSSDEITSEAASGWYVYHAETVLYHQITLKMFGYSVRCIKND